MMQFVDSFSVSALMILNPTSNQTLGSKAPELKKWASPLILTKVGTESLFLGKPRVK